MCPPEFGRPTRELAPANVGVGRLDRRKRLTLFPFVWGLTILLLTRLASNNYFGDRSNNRYLSCSNVPGAGSTWERQLNLTESGLFFLPDPVNTFRGRIFGSLVKSPAEGMVVQLKPRYRDRDQHSSCICHL